MDYECIVFDTAPTGHTLRLLNFPKLLELALEKLITLRQKFEGVIGSMNSVFGNKEKLDNQYETASKRLQKVKTIVTQIKIMMQDPVFFLFYRTHIFKIG